MEQADQERKADYSDEVHAAKRVRTSSSAGAAVSAAFVVLGVFVGNSLLIVTCTLMAIACIAAVVLARRPQTARAGGWLLLGSTWFGLFGCASVSGGVQSPAVWFTLLVPVAGAQLLGWRAGRFWTVAAVAQILLLAATSGLSGVTAADGVIWSSALSALSVAIGAGLTFSGYERQRAIRDAELRQSLGQLAAARDRAQAASEAKTHFLANMSHEIRTPMNGVLGMASVMLADDLSSEQRTRAETLLRSGEGLLAILNEILDFSKIEAGHLAFERVDFCLPEILEQVLELQGPPATAKWIELSAELEVDVPRWVVGDAGRVRQILMNLVGNAVKFTSEGEVRVRVKRAGVGRVRFEVRDTGIGVREGAVEELFKPFSQADDSTTRRYGGTGLGLAICRSIVDRAGGAIGAQARPEGGSLFWFELDLPPGTPTPEGPSAFVSDPAVSLDHLRVLVVEDNAINQIVASSLLKQLGCEVGVAADGAKAVEAVAAEAWDLVLMDCQMPTMDGFEATRRIRQAEGDGQRLTVIAMTAGAMAEDRTACLAAGMDDFVPKPVTMSALEKIVTRAATASRQARWLRGEGAAPDR